MSWRQRIERRDTKLTVPVESPVLADRNAAGNRNADSEEESPEEKEDADDDQLVSQAVPWKQKDAEVTVLFRVQAVLDFTAEESGDLSFKKEEVLSILDSSRRDGWLFASNALGEQGFVPGNYVQQLELLESPSRTNDARLTPVRSGHTLWAKLRSHVQQTNLADVLGAMGALPSGFRESMMAKLLTDSSVHLTSTWLLPEPSSTGMAFSDLRFDHKKGQIVPIPTKVSRRFTILVARMIPACPEKGLKVLSQHIRVAISSKDNILSNIHTVRAAMHTTADTHRRSWRFDTKGEFSLYQRSCVIRLCSTANNPELLFELGITFKREKTGEIGELSCGWSSLPLFDTTGIPIPNRTYELKVHGGSIFEKGVELDSARNIRGGGRIPSVLQINRTPRLYIQMNSCGQSTQRTMNLLPLTIVTSTSYTMVIPCFRQIAATSFLVGRAGLPLLAHVNRPSLNVFLRSIDQADVMDHLLGEWKEQLKAARGSKHDLGHQAHILEKVLLECIYPMLHSPAFLGPVWADEGRELARLEYGKEMLRKDLQDEYQEPVSIAEQVFRLWPPRQPI